MLYLDSFENFSAATERLMLALKTAAEQHKLNISNTLRRLTKEAMYLIPSAGFIEFEKSRLGRTKKMAFAIKYQTQFSSLIFVLILASWCMIGHA